MDEVARARGHQLDVPLVEVRLRPAVRRTVARAPSRRRISAAKATGRLLAAGAMIEVACLVAAPVPVAVVLQVPAADAERHGTEHLTAAIGCLAKATTTPL